ncbi:MAG TPA: SUMF1/EgtB/PvdO family nonheme iron enzyme [Phycisphaerales bacterium]|nr:SUMF1/EgtB/PvdO family nonheme iron enzyme [Phycisphaerales bacterium]
MERKPLSGARIAAIGASLVCTGTAFGGTAPDDDIDWKVIGSPGNPAFAAPSGFFQERGSVPYEYRLATTEITVSQWYEFVVAYSSVIGNAATSISVTGSFIVGYDSPDGHPTFEYAPAATNVPTNLSWRMAARYCNWLTNDKTITADAFERGAYDTSTFGYGPNGELLDQATHSPGAKYWIPTLDEWIKGAHYDPTRGGDDPVSAWRNYPYGLDRAPIPGDPLLGGETNAGLFGLVEPEFDFSSGRYADQSSPWGLLDISGGMTEWTEEKVLIWRVVKGSGFFSSPSSTVFEDNIRDRNLASPDSISLYGLRIASAVPAPSSSVIVLGIVFLKLRRSR